jgi:hypothetical protein
LIGGHGPFRSIACVDFRVVCGRLRQRGCGSEQDADDDDRTKDPSTTMLIPTFTPLSNDGIAI